VCIERVGETDSQPDELDKILDLIGKSSLAGHGMYVYKKVCTSGCKKIKLVKTVPHWMYVTSQMISMSIRGKT
jgi:hypothetical protein